MGESHIPLAVNVIVGFPNVDEVKVVEEPLPVIEVGVASIELPGCRPSQQDVDDVPGTKHRAGQTWMALVWISIDNEPPAQHKLPGPRRMVLLGVLPQRRRARIRSDVLRTRKMKGQAGRVAADLTV